LEQLRQRLTDEQTSLVVKKSEILGKAQEEAAQVLRRTKQEAEGIIGELKHQLANSSVQDKQQVILKTRQRLKDNRAALGVLDEAPDMRGRAARPGEILLGAAVYVPSLGQKGIIHGISGDQAVVQMGIMKMNLELSHCRLLDEGPTVNYVPERVANGFAQSQDISRQVDIRGMTIEEGEQVLDKYLDSAVLAGLGETIIIHGKGTGALKKGIRTYLKSHRSVKSIRIGELNEGGDGVTVATLQ
jgi:DNA mismatch repair protein MutS2